MQSEGNSKCLRTVRQDFGVLGELERIRGASEESPKGFRMVFKESEGMFLCLKTAGKDFAASEESPKEDLERPQRPRTDSGASQENRKGCLKRTRKVHASRVWKDFEGFQETQTDSATSKESQKGCLMHLRI